MIKFIKKNKIISVFASFSVFIVVSYAITYSMPDYFGIEGWYSLFNNIAISYIAAMILYVLQVYIPDCKNQTKAQIVMKPLFIKLVEFLEITIVCCRKYVTIKDNEEIMINWSNIKDKSIYFVPVKNGKEETRPAVKKTIDDIRYLDETFKININEIKEKIYFKMCDDIIQNILSELEMTDFYKTKIISVLTFDATYVPVKNFQQSIDELEKIKDKFKKNCGITDIYEIRDPQKEEIAAYEAILHDNALQARTVDEFIETVLRRCQNMK